MYAVQEHDIVLYAACDQLMPARAMPTAGVRTLLVSRAVQMGAIPVPLGRRPSAANASAATAHRHHNYEDDTRLTTMIIVIL